MKKHIIIAFCLFTFHSLYAQLNNLIQVGYGGANLIGIDSSRFTDVSLSKVYNLKLQRSINKHFNLGLSMSYYSGSGSDNYTISKRDPVTFLSKDTKHKRTYFATSFCSLIRFEMKYLKGLINKSVEPYIGGGIGYCHIQTKIIDEGPGATKDSDELKELNLENSFTTELTVGLRFWIIKNIGIYGEIGAGKPSCHFGLSGRF